MTDNLSSLRVLQILPRLEGGGVEEETLLIAKAIIAVGGQAFVASEGGALVGALEEAGASHITLPLGRKNPIALIRNAFSLCEHIKFHQINVLHVRSRAPAWSTFLAAKWLKRPWVSTCHAAYKDQNLLKHFYNSVMVRASRVIAISHFIENHIYKTYSPHKWFKPKSVRLVPRGIDFGSFAGSQISIETTKRLRESLQIPPQNRIILLPGRFSPVKGHGLLLEAFAALREKDATLLFVGQTASTCKNSSGLEHHAKILGVTSALRCLPYTQDIRPFYALADIVVVPSLAPEGFGRVIAEAAAFEKILIVSSHGAAPEIVASKEMGFLVPPGDRDALENALKEALSLSDEARHQMGRKVWDHIESSFSEKQFYDKTLSVYLEVLNLP